MTLRNIRNDYASGICVYIPHTGRYVFLQWNNVRHKLRRTTKDDTNIVFERNANTAILPFLSRAHKILIIDQIVFMQEYNLQLSEMPSL